MNTEIYDQYGVLRELQDVTARIVFYYDEQGVLIGQDPFTPEQNAAADLDVATAAAAAELAALRTAVKAIVTDVKAERDKLDARFIVNGSQVSNATITANPGPFVKDNYSSVRKTMNAVIDLAKLVKDI